MWYSKAQRMPPLGLGNEGLMRMMLKRDNKIISLGPLAEKANSVDTYRTFEILFMTWNIAQL